MASPSTKSAFLLHPHHLGSHEWIFGAVVKRAKPETGSMLAAGSTLRRGEKFSSVSLPSQRR